MTNPTQPAPEKPGYNERLFDGTGIRAKLHNARFNWFRSRVGKFVEQPLSLVELGCFDGRLIAYCPNPPIIYQGFDADWEGGLSDAQNKFRGQQNWAFDKAIDASSMKPLQSNTFNIGAAMETLEHIPVELLDDYLAELSRVIDGYFFVTVPNEKGLVFLTKYLAKRFVMKSHQEYSCSEILSATLGRSERVERNEHKGFDHAKLTRHIAQHFELVSVEGVPFPHLPLSMAFTVGIVARNKKFG